MRDPRRDQPWFPDLCRLPRLAALLGLAALVVVVLALAPDGAQGWSAYRFLSACGLAMWLALAVAVLLCKLRAPLSRLSQRLGALAALAVAALLLAGTVWLALRVPRRVLRVLAPMALSTLLILAVLRGLGVELNLFHLVSLILAAGLGLDYALFFDHAGDDRGEQLRTLHAVIVCSLTTLLVFSLLALSSIPVLRAIGSTVTIGVLGNFVLGLLIARQPATRAERAHA